MRGFGRRRFGVEDGALGGDFGGGRGLEVEGKGLEAFQFVEGVAIVALGGIDASLEAREGAVAVVEGVTEWGVGVELVRALHFVDPDLGFGGGKTAEGPGGADQDIDLVALLGDSGAVALEVLVGEGGEMGGIFAGNDE